MNDVLAELLRDCRDRLQDELESEIDANTSTPGDDVPLEKKRRSLDREGRAIVRPLDRLIARIDQVLADNRGDGI